LAGFAPGESELPDEEILRRRAARQEAQPFQGGFTGQPSQSTQMAPTEGAQPGGSARAPVQAVLAQLMSRPGMIEHLEGIDLDGDGLPDIPLGPPP
ncbi:MAG: hypothetical protein ACLGQW_11955, partial [Acidobacteriota bacterium]